MPKKARCLATQLNAGFSLVELAIVLVVIGLIIGGVLKGQQLIESARLKSVLSQLNEFRLATGIFIDRFGGLPGDFQHAKEYIHSSLRNGSGNGIIEGAGLQAGTEAQQYWMHLSKAQLISFSGSENSDSIGFGITAPASRLGGGYTVVYHPESDMPGHWYLLGEALNGHGDGALLTPAQALSLDQQVDTGMPTSGRVRSFTGKGAKSECIVKGFYNLQYTGRACIMYFEF
ncbi:MAG: prepilin-type N-terminal cleavage/methylation domain-containing protein [Pseudomonadota bacterium]